MNNLTVVLTFIGVMVAIFALVYQMYQAESTRRQEAFAKETARRQEEAARRQEVGVAEWMRALRDWASEAIDVLSEAVYASDGMQELVPRDTRRYIPQLSSLIDRGRFFLPNQFTENHGTDKPPAFRGFRHAALDPLVAAADVLEGKIKDEELHDYVAHHRRDVLRWLQMEFVSHIQQILDPEGHNQKIAEVIKDSQAQAAKLLGKKDFGFHTIGLVRHVVERVKEESTRQRERQGEAPPEST